MRLRYIFGELAAVKDDSQQRSWILHEDEQTICNHLNELIAILVRNTALFLVLSLSLSLSDMFFDKFHLFNRFPQLFYDAKIAWRTIDKLPIVNRSSCDFRLIEVLCANNYWCGSATM